MSDNRNLDPDLARLEDEIEANIFAALSAATHMQDKFLIYMLAIAVQHLSECRERNLAKSTSSLRQLQYTDNPTSHSQ